MKARKSMGPIKGEYGYTLLEVVVAISILTIGLLAVVSMLATSIRGSTTAGSSVEATTWAQDKLEDLMARPYGDVTSGVTWEDEYRIESTVGSVSGVPSVKRITVRVEWSGPGGEKHTELTGVKPEL
jgi:prepilin-type N-terminal cleavage/methylation domain-containing protein